MGIDSFEDDLYTGMSKDSSKFLIETRNIGTRDEEIFLDLQATIWVYDSSSGFFSDSLVIQSG